MNSFNPELSLNNTESSIKNKLIDLLSELRGFKFVTTFLEEFKKNSTFCLNSKVGTVINKSDIDNAFESIYNTILLNKHKSLGKGSGWMIDSGIYHTINISKYIPFSWWQLHQITKRITSKKGLIDIQNIDDNECFKWC